MAFHHEENLRADRTGHYHALNVGTVPETGRRRAAKLGRNEASHFPEIPLPNCAGRFHIRAEENQRLVGTI